MLKLLREISVHLHDGLEVVSACGKAGISDKSYYIGLRILEVLKILFKHITSDIPAFTVKLALDFKINHDI